MARRTWIVLFTWLAAGCLSAPPGGGDGLTEADAGPPGSTVWQIPLGSSGPYVAMDGDDLVVVAGFRGTVELDPPLTAKADSADLLVAGFAGATGAQRFAAGYGGPGNEQPTAVAVSQLSHEVAVFGLYGVDEANLGGDAMPAPTDMFNLFAARYGPDGDHLWSFPGLAEAFIFPAFALSMSGTGDLALSGTHASAFDIGGATVPYSAGGSNLFFVRLREVDGTATARASYGAEGTDGASGAFYDGLGSLYLIGTHTAGFALDDVSPDSDSDGAMFVIQIDDTGLDASWMIDSVGGTVGGLRGAVTPDGRLLLTGWFEGSFAFDTHPTELTARGGSDVFIAVISPDGTVEWIEQLGGAGDDEPRGVAVGPDGQFAVTGLFRGQASLGDEVELAANGGADVFLVAFDSQRAVRWSRSFGDVEDDTPLSVAAAEDGGVVLGTLYRGEVDFGGEQPLSSGGQDAGAVVRFR